MPSARPRLRPFLLPVLLGLMLATAALGPASWSDWPADLVEIACAAAILARAARSPRPLAWSLLGVGIALWAAGDVMYSWNPDLPVPSVADAAWLGYYLPTTAALVLLTRTRTRGVGRAVWLDGVIAGLAVAALGAATVLGPVVVTATGGRLATVVNLAYPAGDVALLALVVVALTVTGRSDRSFLLLAAGLALTSVADGLYMALYAIGAWPDAGVLNALWPCATVMLAAAAWSDRPSGARARPSGMGQIVVPVAGAAVAVGVVTAATTTDVIPAAVGLGASTLVLAIGRLALTFAEKERALAVLQLRATTDPLTDLPNHREFHERLAAEVERARRHERRLSVVMIDLDHFKLVNDHHGHPAGDRTLAHVARTIAAMVRPGDTLARVGGEEFAWILPEADALEAWQATERVRERLLASPVPGVGRVGFSAGVCDLGEVPEPLGGPELVRLADGALYWAKRNGRGVTFRYSPAVVRALSAEEMAASAVRESSLTTVRALARTVDARDPHTQGHSERVAELASAIAADLGWEASDRLRLHEAALVHDIGKIGVPDEVLLSRGPLSHAERAIIEAHAAAGARIVAGALSDEQASWIRAHHERHDGTGYPDGLAGDAIPEGARILAVADAFDAMTSSRGDRGPLPRRDALRECRAASGTRFWPPAVDALPTVAREARESVL